MIRFHPEAAREMEDALDFYETRRLGLGLRFMGEVGNALAEIKKHSSAWMKLDKGAMSLRRHLLKTFPFGLIYELKDGDILIWCVMHLSRKPGYWKIRRA